MKKILLLFTLFTFMVAYGEEIAIENTDKIVGQTTETRIDNDTNWGPYMRYLESRIKQNWAPPKNYSSKKIVTKITILKNGMLSDVEIIKSSGFKLADDAAVEAVKKAFPLEPLPKKFKGEFVPVEFTFEQYLNNLPYDTTTPLYDNCKTKFCKLIYKNQ